MKNNKALTRILFLALVGVWGTIAYQVYASIAFVEHDESRPSVSGGTTLNSPEVPYIYLNDTRDPFSHSVVWRTKRDTTMKKRNNMAVVKPSTSPPLFKLTGIVTSGKRRTAVLEIANGGIALLSEGDSANGIRVLKITQQAVTYIHEKELGMVRIPHD